MTTVPTKTMRRLSDKTVRTVNVSDIEANPDKYEGWEEVTDDGETKPAKPKAGGKAGAKAGKAGEEQKPA